MFRKFSSKINNKKRDKVSRSPSKLSPQGAAVPYTDPSDSSSPDHPIHQQEGSIRSHDSSIGGASSLVSSSSAEYGEGHVLGEAAAHGDIEGTRQLLKSGYDINGRDEVGSN